MQRMTEPEKKKLLRKNTILWIAAMAIAPVFDVGFRVFATGPVKFPWGILTPLLMVGLYASSNSLLKGALEPSIRDDGADADGA